MILTSTAFQSKLNTTDRTIRSKIDLYDTRMAVPSKGIQFKMWDWDGITTPSWTGDMLFPTSGYGVVPNLAIGWAYASPFFVNTDRYAVEFYGYFYAEATSADFGFYVFGEDQHIELIFDSTTLISSTVINGYEASTTDSVTSGNWYPFTFRVYGVTGDNRGGIVLKYTYDLSSVDTTDFRSSDLKIVNAGVVNSSASYLSATSITGHNNIEGRRSENEPSEYTFELPYSEYTKQSNGSYGTEELAEGKLIKIYAGYECDSTPTATETIGDVVGDVEYLPRFIGSIFGFSVDRESNILTVICRDHFSRAEQQMCINYPDHISYWSANYFKDTDGNEPNGVSKPLAYDRWGVVDTIKDLLLRAGIPASLFYGVEQRRKADDDLYDSIDSVYDGGFRLDEAHNYGTSEVEEYVNTFDVGTTIYDAVMKITDTYGYLIEFDYAGNLHFFPRNNTTVKISDEGSNLSDSSDTNNYVTVGGASPTDYEVLENYEYLGAGATILKTTTGILNFNNVPGTGFTLIFKRDNTSGIADNSNEYWNGTASVKIEIRNTASAIVETYNYNLYLEEDWYYHNGTFSKLGANPCVIPLAQDLVYDDYDIIITPLSTYDITVDELWVYHYNHIDPVKTLGTYLSAGAIGTIKDIAFERSMEDQRNDILVVGQRKGLWVATGNKEVGLSDPDFSENLNNQFTNYHSRNIDIDSIYNPFASNYIGRHLMTYIQEPNINTKDRAQWLSFNVLNKYRNLDNRVDISLIGDAELNLQDPVYIKDKLEESGSRAVWIKGLNEKITHDEWNVDVDVVGKEPFPSYDRVADYDTSKTNDKFIANFTINDGFGYSRDGSKSTTTSIFGLHTWTGVTILCSDSVDTWHSGSDFVVVVYHESYSRYGVFKVTGSSGNTLTGSWLYKTDTGSKPMTTLPPRWNVANIYNPYEQDDYSNFMRISLTVLVEGVLSIGVQSRNYEVLGYIAGITNGGGLDENNMPKEQHVVPGDEIDFIWGGVDETGKTHDALYTDETTDRIGSGFFAEDEDYYFNVSLVRKSDGKPVSFNTDNYTDESGNKQSQIVSLAKSAVDSHTMSYSFEDNTREIGEYTPGSNRDRITTNRMGGQNINRVWVSSDGDIEIKLKSVNLDIMRPYYIRYSAEGCITSGWIGLSQNLLQEKVIDDKNWNGGVPVEFGSSDENAYTFLFNPKWNRFGGVDHDSHWNSFFKTNAVARGMPRQGAFYWVRLLLDIRDMSGRKVKLMIAGEPFFWSPARTWTIQDLLDRGNASFPMYSENNFDSVLEFVQIPVGIDEMDSAYYFRWFKFSQAQAEAGLHDPPFEVTNVARPVCAAVCPVAEFEAGTCP